MKRNHFILVLALMLAVFAAFGLGRSAGGTADTRADATQDKSTLPEGTMSQEETKEEQTPQNQTFTEMAMGQETFSTETGQAEFSTQKEETISEQEPETVFPGENLLENPLAAGFGGAIQGVTKNKTLKSALKKYEIKRIVDPDKPMVALTFDDGPHGTRTDQILDILEKNNAVATFFELGSLMKRYPKVDQRAEKLGCEVGCHSWNHSNLNKMSASQIKKDFNKCNQVFQDTLGHKIKLMRPPYGNCNDTVKKAVEVPLILWSVDTLDWKSRNTDKVVSAVKSVKNLDGKVVLMHSIYSTTVDATEKLVPWLQKQGYQLVTISELLKYKYGVDLNDRELYGYNFFS